MNDSFLKEKDFETALVNHFVNVLNYVEGHYGPQYNNEMIFDKKLALDSNSLLDFVKKTQTRSWDRLVRNFGPNSEKSFLESFNKTVRDKGLLDVIKNGFSLGGARFHVMFTLPEDPTSPDMDLFRSNIFVCARQFHYSQNESKKSIDIVLLINGIPVVAIEIKNELTGQSTADAELQYCEDRSQDDLFFRKNQRCLVMFALDNYTVSMTPMLEGKQTRFFPFNQGTEGPGKFGGSGNPHVEGDFDTAYLYKDILTKESLMRIIQSYIVEDRDEGIMIFPRYHQLHCVNTLVDLTLNEGPGHNYLIEHSAGSGKSNTIAWLAYRLLGLHDGEGNSVFNAVIIVVHRRVLDGQLNDTLQLFRDLPGTVVGVDSSAQLREEILDGHKVIISTIQKFSMIKEAIKPQDGESRRYAVICDEAHDSETGKASRSLRKALGEKEISKEDLEQIDQDVQDEGLSVMVKKEFKAMGIQDNLNFYAFTATPKRSTLDTFGRDEPGTGRKVPHHVYSMRQAIEEGFICDVLSDYNSYKVYYQLVKNAAEDPLVDDQRAKRLLQRFYAEHDYNIDKISEIIVQYYHETTAMELGGRAQAMVVVESRAEALKYKKAIDRIARERGFLNIHAMVAFSGTLDDDGQIVTEGAVNVRADGTPVYSSQIEREFKDGSYFNIMVVADKFQVGFDDPRLTTMFVIKRLSDVSAVQTLSRINRIYKGHTKPTHVVDFVNDPQDILTSFMPYYGETALSEPLDPARAYDYFNRLEGFKIIFDDEVRETCKVLSSGSSDTLQKVSSLLGKAKGRFSDLDSEQRSSFRRTLRAFVNYYNHVTSSRFLMDPNLLMWYQYCTYLDKVLPADESEEIPDIEQMVNLEFYRIVNAGKQDLVLDQGDDLTPPTGDAGSNHKKFDPLSEIIRSFNDKYGLDFDDGDRIRQMILETTDSAVEDPTVQEYFETSSKEDFIAKNSNDFQNGIVQSAMANLRFHEILLSKEGLIEDISKATANLAYERLSKK